MNTRIDFKQQKTSWIKDDIVLVMEVVSSIQSIEQFKNKEAIMDEDILKSFLGIQSLHDPIPTYWIELQKYPKEKRLFALLAVIFTDGSVINDFANTYASNDFKGIFTLAEGAQSVNIRSALVAAEAASPVYRKKTEVPYDLSLLFDNPNVGKLFKQLLMERIARLSTEGFDDSAFYTICFDNNFHKALSCTQDQFKAWLEGSMPKNKIVSLYKKTAYMKTVNIANFFSIKDVHLDFGDSKEIYFLGENGDGKSLILMAIYIAFKRNFIVNETTKEKTGKIEDILKQEEHTVLTGTDSLDNEFNFQNDLYLDHVFGYGAHRGRYTADKWKVEEYGFMSLFDIDQELLDPEKWLLSQYALELEAQKHLIEALEFYHPSPKLPEKTFSSRVVNPVQYSTRFLQKVISELLETRVEIEVTADKVIFKEKGLELSFEQLSEGYRSTLIFVIDLIYRLSVQVPKEFSPFHEGTALSDLQGVVLVDEIDLHLHLKWQRVIVRRLRSIFPKVQFIFTTHSPTIIQGASDDAVIYRIYRNQTDGETKVSDPYYRKDLNHLMINTLVTSPLFGLEDSRMDTTNDHADTSDTYLSYRLNLKVEESIQKQKSEGKVFFTDSEIDQLIAEILEDDQN